MDLDLARERFETLARSDTRPLMARFRDVFEHVEAAVAAGVSHAQARDELAQLGLELDLKTFSVFLWRVRRERGVPPRRGKRNAPAHAAAPATQTTQEAPAVRASTPRPALDMPKPAAPVAHVHPALPEDWLTAKITPDQFKLLTREQRTQRRAARDRKYHKSIWDDLPDMPGTRS